MAAQLRLILLGVWAGEMLAFGFIFLPATFLNLPTTQAAKVLGDGFVYLDLSAIALGVITTAIGVVLLRRHPAPSRLAMLGVALPVVGVICHTLGWAYVSPELRDLRLAGGGTIGGLAANDPGLERFGDLHRASQGLFWLALASAVGACALGLVKGPADD